MINWRWPWNARLIIPTTFDECLTYGQRQEFMWRKIEELENRLDELDELTTTEDATET